MRVSEFTIFRSLVHLRAAALAAATAVAMWIFLPAHRPDAIACALAVWYICSPLRIEAAPYNLHAFSVNLFLIEAPLEVEIFSNGYFLRPKGRIRRAVFGSVFIDIERSGYVRVCGARYYVSRLVSRGLVGAISNPYCPDAACVKCRPFFVPGCGCRQTRRRAAR